MKIYLVGGAVRDALLNIPVLEKDWVVVGSSPQELSDQGFMPVGSQFPVFLHPTTKEEYALARTERKSGKGHKGFVFHTDPSVTIEDDLIRRDITINAIAQDSEGNLVDPYGGQKDLEKKIIRKVSTAFKEDPLRVYRVCRFAAKLNYLGFVVEEETISSMEEIVQSGELSTLPKERIWMETYKALGTQNPETYFKALKDCGALGALIGDINLDTDALKRISKETGDSEKRWAALLGSQKEGHKINNYFNAPKLYSDTSDIFVKLAKFHINKKNTAEQILTLIKSTDALRRSERFQNAALAYSICNLEGDGINWGNLLLALKAIRPSNTKKSGPEISAELEQSKLESIKIYLEEG